MGRIGGFVGILMGIIMLWFAHNYYYYLIKKLPGILQSILLLPMLGIGIYMTGIFLVIFGLMQLLKGK